MLVRRIARPLLAAIFIYGGFNALRDVKGHAKAAGPLIDKTLGPLTESLPEQIPTDPETLVRADACVKIGAGAMLASGKCPRVAALMLSGSLIPTTLSSHAFWELDDPDLRSAQLIQFLKNLGLLGGLLITAVDTGGKPSMAYRARYGAYELSRQTRDAVHAAKTAAKD